MENDQIAEPILREILAIIIKHRLGYKRDAKVVEQKLRAEEVNKSSRTRYLNLVIADCKKLKQRNDEARTVILKALGVSQHMYEDEVRAMGDESAVEKQFYDEIVKEYAGTHQGLALRRLALAIRADYERQMEQATAYLKTDPEFRKTVTNEALGKENSELLPRMMALDGMYCSFQLDDVSFDAAMLHAEEIGRQAEKERIACLPRPSTLN
ncbi:MAG: hypothetical protein P4M11_02005 [Candidatus Pacebacteria bacterium]|nr:hypothetical protein [Candidatus Paceibacterota bacterium]